MSKRAVDPGAAARDNLRPSERRLHRTSGTPSYHTDFRQSSIFLHPDRPYGVDDARTILVLQRLAGNVAVSTLMQRRSARSQQSSRVGQEQPSKVAKVITEEVPSALRVQAVLQTLPTFVQTQPKGDPKKKEGSTKKKSSKKTLPVERITTLIDANNKSSVSTELLLCLIWKESSLDPTLTSAKSSATGLMQVTKPAVLDVNRNSPKSVHFEHSEMTDPAKNIACGTRYLELRIKRAGGDLKAGLEGYGTGAGYADNILSCESCIQAVQEAIRRIGSGLGPPNPAICLEVIHK